MRSPPLPRLVATLALVLVPASAPAEDGEALEATVDRIWARGDSLKVDFAIQGLLNERIRDGLARGLPMTYSFEIELWRDRSSWWDALVARRVVELKIQQNVWDDRYFVEALGGGRLSAPDLDALERVLCDRRGELVTNVGALESERSYFVVVVPTLRPLTIEDLREVEQWLTGEFETGRKRSGISLITGLPGTVFGIFRDLAGLGDRSTIARSGRFRYEVR